MLAKGSMVGGGVGLGPREQGSPSGISDTNLSLHMQMGLVGPVVTGVVRKMVMGRGFCCLVFGVLWVGLWMVLKLLLIK